MTNDNKSNKNPCSICRSMGLSGCKGHGGGGGGGDDATESDDIAENQEAITFENQPIAAQILVLSSFLEKSMNWREEKGNDFLYSFDEFNSEASLSSIQLDLANVRLVLIPKEQLNTESKKDLNFLLKQIKAQANQFEGISIIENDDVLEFKCSSTQSFDAFIEHLMNQNLIPVDNDFMQTNLDVSNQVSATPDEPGSSWAPNPFDISKGPMPPKE